MIHWQIIRIVSELEDRALSISISQMTLLFMLKRKKKLVSLLSCTRLRLVNNNNDNNNNNDKINPDGSKVIKGKRPTAKRGQSSLMNDPKPEILPRMSFHSRLKVII